MEGIAKTQATSRRTTGIVISVEGAVEFFADSFLLTGNARNLNFKPMLLAAWVSSDLRSTWFRGNFHFQPMLQAAWALFAVAKGFS
jgi:hypothetical protein